MGGGQMRLRRRKLKCCLALAVCACGSSLARATTFTWTNAAGGIFSTATNWTPIGGPPALATDLADFFISNAYTITFANSPVNGSFQAGDGTVTLNLNG